MLLFAVLDELVGEEQFNRIMGEYHQRFAATGATTDEFVVLARSLSDLELGPFFHDWMYTTQWYHYVRDGATREDLVAVYRPPEQDQ
jgi:hypothetical protein